MVTYLEIQAKKNKLWAHYKENSSTTEPTDAWHLGVTCQGREHNKYQLQRIAAHSGAEFPNLDAESIYFLEVSSLDVALQLETEMNALGFDTGSQHDCAKKDERTRVYLFKKK